MSAPTTTSGPVEALLQAAVAWAKGREDVLGVALVGSHARGTAGPTSDVDLVLVVRAVETLFANDGWLSKFGRVLSIEHEDHGLVRSRRVRYQGGLEVEWGLTDARWCVTEPLDHGTAEVIAAGARVLFDPHGMVGALAAAVARR